MTSRSSSLSALIVSSSRRRSSAATATASGDGAASPGRKPSVRRSSSWWRRPDERTRLRASLATIRSSQGRRSAPARNRSSARNAFMTYPPDRVRELKQKAWLHRIAVNVFRNRVRGTRPRLVELNGNEPDRGVGPEADVIRRAEIDALVARVACLPLRYREAVVLRHVHELSYAEAAEALGQPVGTVKANVHRGLKILRGDDQ